MGRPRIKVIETALEPKAAEKLEEKKLEISEEANKKVVKQAKAAKKNKETKPKVRSKRYGTAHDLIDKTKDYPINEAIELIKKTSTVKFDSSLEVHINLNVDTSKSDQLIRKSINLPFGSGKTIRVLVFGLDSKQSKDSAVVAGSDKTIDEIEKGKVDFDKIVSTPDWMPKLTKVAKVLGPKGLMPNPKSGTITENPAKLLEDLKGGLIEVKVEKEPIIHATTGKISLPDEKLAENVKTLVSEIQKAKPESLKKPLIKSVYLSSSMGPSVKLEVSSLSQNP